MTWLSGTSARTPTPPVRRPARRNRLYRHGLLELEDFPSERISDHLSEPGTVVWLDLDAPDAADLALLAQEFGLADIAVDNVLQVHQRPKVDRHAGGHLFMSLYGVRVSPVGAELATSELAVLAGDRWLITIRKSGDFDMDHVRAASDGNADLATSGVGFLLHGLLDAVVDEHFTAVQVLDEAAEAMEADLFSEAPRTTHVQRRSFALRKALVELRRVALPMREVLDAFLRRDVHLVDATLQPYYADVHNHVLRVTDWTESLRDHLGSIQDADLQMQSNHTNEVMRRLAAYAAIFAAGTAITGFYGMNVLFPQVQSGAGAVTASALLAAATIGLIAWFRRNRWL
jgi:magnesium transporter